MPVTENRHLAARIRACGVHVLASLVVAALVSVVVLRFWYPETYATLAGGKQLFWLVISVDVVLGPLLTFVVFDVSKSRSELTRDVAVIACLQVAALGYGLHVAHEARPVALVFEVDRFRVISASDVRLEELPGAPPEFRNLPLTGPWTLGTREPRSGDERLESISLALEGFDVSQRPSFWTRYEASRKDALAVSRPVSMLLRQYPENEADIRLRLEALGLESQSARFVPLVSRASGWLVLLEPTGNIAGFAPYEGFF